MVEEAMEEARLEAGMRGLRIHGEKARSTEPGSDDTGPGAGGGLLPIGRSRSMDPNYEFTGAPISDSDSPSDITSASASLGSSDGFVLCRPSAHTDTADSGKSASIGEGRRRPAKVRSSPAKQHAQGRTEQAIQDTMGSLGCYYFYISTSRFIPE